MKKFFLVSFIVVIVIIMFSFYKIIFNKGVKTVLEETEEENFYLDDVRIFGNHMNIRGCIDTVLEGDLSLLLKNDDQEITIDSKFESESGKTCFKLSDKNNEGINLDELNVGKYLLLVKNVVEEDETFYTIENITDYKTLEYYSITKNNKNKKIDFKSDLNKDLDKNYIEFNIKDTKLPDDVYDITIDPGHGGIG